MTRSEFRDRLEQAVKDGMLSTARGMVVAGTYRSKYALLAEVAKGEAVMLTEEDGVKFYAKKEVATPEFTDTFRRLVTTRGKMVTDSGRPMSSVKKDIADGVLDEMKIHKSYIIIKK